MADRVEEMAREAACEIYAVTWDETDTVLVMDTAIIARNYRELVAPLVEAARQALSHAAHTGDAGSGCMAWGYHRPTGRYWAEGDEKTCTCELKKIWTALRDYPTDGEGGSK